MALTPEDIRNAAKAIHGRIVKTLCAPSKTLSEIIQELSQTPLFTPLMRVLLTSTLQY
jgi:hypothetical protein